ncbi:hypothetical protein GCL60_11975 [Silvanigrella paludirubra]|uniref:Topo IA-type catalytic domain-containing protein n=1 Tax=Silvanigrella paludirubra TaxID=2499159 RepID=A0A6N6VVK2_9BACT|nr:DNA topoisomerase [Silvanigrella paludirubra]KAB8037885.1 hypothetical protein GCL60_11975 [Silvanigrella paludirubra]
MNLSKYAHPQISPVNFKFTPEIMDKFLISPNKEVYKLIYQGAFATLKEPAVINMSGFVLTSCNNNEIKLLFTSAVLLTEGWLGVDDYKRQEYMKEFTNSDTTLNEIYQEADLLEFDGVRIFSVEEPFIKLDEFISQLEIFNIGKPSTYASIFENLEKNIRDGFIEKKSIKEGLEQKECTAYEITNKGENFLEKFSQINDPFLDLNAAKEFENYLQQISNGELTRDEFEKKYFSIFPQNFLNKITLKWIDNCD